MMVKILHHLAALGWGWTALFLLLDAVAIGCAVLALVSQERRLVSRAFLWSALATVGILGSSMVAQMVGLDAAFRATASNRDPSLKARDLAEGISTTMNAVAFGLLFTGIAGVASLVCLAMLLLGPRTDASADPQSAEKPGT